MVAPSHLKSLQALELAVRTGSLKAAADILGISPAAVGQRVKALEDYLGLELFTRGRTGLRPTPALEAALPHLVSAFRDLESATAALDLQRGQEIHIAATPDLADIWLRPRLAAFQAEHPNVRFCVNGEGDAPLRLGRMDCEISFTAPREGEDLLFRDYVLPLASPDITRRLAALTEHDRLEGFPLLHLDFYKDDRAAPDWARWIAAQGLNRSAPERGIRFQRIRPVVEALLADAGLAICGLALTADLVEAGGLSLPFPVASGAWTERAFSARFRREALLRPQVRRFREWLLDEGARTAGRLTGLVAAAPGVG
jgi:LysR family glycine cleavage system transcriptional activator